MSTASQEARILRHLKAGHGLTPIGALNRFNCFRLSGRILSLRQQGHRIRTDTVKRGNKRFARYTLAA